MITENIIIGLIGGVILGVVNLLVIVSIQNLISRRKLRKKLKESDLEYEKLKEARYKRIKF